MSSTAAGAKKEKHMAVQAESVSVREAAYGRLAARPDRRGVCVSVSVCSVCVSFVVGVDVAPRVGVRSQQVRVAKRKHTHQCAHAHTFDFVGIDAAHKRQQRQLPEQNDAL